MSVSAQIREFYDLVGEMRRSRYQVNIVRKPGFDRNKLKAELVIEGHPRVWIYDFREKLWATYPGNTIQNGHVENG